MTCLLLQFIILFRLVSYFIPATSSQALNRRCPSSIDSQRPSLVVVSSYRSVDCNRLFAVYIQIRVLFLTITRMIAHLACCSIKSLDLVGRYMKSLAHIIISIPTRTLQERASKNKYPLSKQLYHPCSDMQYIENQPSLSIFRIRHQIPSRGWFGRNCPK